MPDINNNNPQDQEANVSSQLMQDQEAEKLDGLVQAHAEETSAADLPVDSSDEKPAPAPDDGNQHIRTNGVTIPASSNWDAMQLLPRDRNREELHIQVRSGTATDYVIYADDSSKMNSDAGRVYAGQEIVLWNYQGPIWIQAVSGFTGPIYVGVTSVTK